MAPITRSLRSSAIANSSDVSPTSSSGGPHVSLPILAASITALLLAVACLIFFTVRFIRSRRPVDYTQNPDAKLSLRALRLPLLLRKREGSSSLCGTLLSSKGGKDYILPLHQRQISLPTLICGTGPIAIARPEAWTRSDSVQSLQCMSSTTTTAEPQLSGSTEERTLPFQGRAPSAVNKLEEYKPLVVKKKQSNTAEVNALSGQPPIFDVVNDYEKLVDELLGEGTMRMAEIASGLHPADESDIAIEGRSSVLLEQSMSSSSSSWGLIDQVLQMAKLGLMSSRTANVPSIVSPTENVCDRSVMVKLETITEVEDETAPSVGLSLEVDPSDTGPELTLDASLSVYSEASTPTACASTPVNGVEDESVSISVYSVDSDGCPSKEVKTILSLAVTAGTKLKETSYDHRVSELIDLIESPVITPDKPARSCIDLSIPSCSPGRGPLAPCGPGFGRGSFPFIPEMAVRERERTAALAARREVLEQVKKGRLVHLPFDADSDVMAARRAIFEAAYSSTKHFAKVMETSESCKVRRQNPPVEVAFSISDTLESADSTSLSTISEEPIPVPIADSSKQNVSSSFSGDSRDSGLLPYTELPPSFSEEFANLSAELSASSPPRSFGTKLETSASVSPPETAPVAQTVFKRTLSTSTRCCMVSPRTVQEQRRRLERERLRSKENDAPQHSHPRASDCQNPITVKPLTGIKNAKIYPNKTSIARPEIPALGGNYPQPKMAEQPPSSTLRRTLRTERRSIAPVSPTRSALGTQLQSTIVHAQKQPLRSITNTFH